MKKNDLRLYFRLLKYVKLYWSRFLVAALAMLLVSGITAMLAYLVKPFLDDVFFKKNLQMLYLLPPCWWSSTPPRGASPFPTPTRCATSGNAPLPPCGTNFSGTCSGSPRPSSTRRPPAS